MFLEKFCGWQQEVEEVGDKNDKSAIQINQKVWGEWEVRILRVNGSQESERATWVESFRPNDAADGGDPGNDG